MSGTTPEPDRRAELLSHGHRAWSRLDAFQAVSFFADETRERYKALGIRPRYAYFAGRVAPMGPVPAEVCAAVFYVFSPRLVAEALPGAWAAASPERVLDARLTGTREVLTRVLADVLHEPGAGEQLSEAAELARRACTGLTLAGRPLAAGYASMPWPDDALMVLWQAASLIREHRGDGHMSALVHAPLDPVESIITSGVDTGTTPFLRATRGWSDDEWDAARGRLLDRGLLRDAADGDELTDEGVALRRSVERQTDLAGAEPWTRLGLDGTVRLGELLRPFTKAVLRSGVLPAGLGVPRP